MITILLAAYNGGKYLEAFLDSLKGQTVRDWQLIAFDDGSTDNTQEIIRNFAFNNENKVYFKVNDPACGSARDNFSMLIKEARNKGADYCLFADQDDVWEPDKIETLMSAMEEAEKRYSDKIPVMVHSDLKVVDESLNTIADSFFEYQQLDKKIGFCHLLIQNNVTGCASVINKTCLKAAADTIGSPEVIMHDYWCALIAATFGKLIFIDEPTVLYRQHGDNEVGAKNSRNLKYLKKRISDGAASYEEAMDRSYRQCRYFYESFKDYDFRKTGRIEKKLELIKEYSDLQNAGKLEKIAFYRRHGVWKKGAARKAAQVLWS
ncbi:MAG: glycosyltransferase family 2 protein [Lachnospiraceae bacterium]|jgi:glycosyltransferase involved in cell wall biosynthesis|nr:glycosyltransferase family 2 protein [Lachnospiraceae bacterium]MEE3460403.1 glycosyltransferase family 2 protein [Lachnospiraceae bacterium]